MTDAAAPILTLDRVTFGFPRRPDFLKPVTLSIARGDLWAVIGPNGAGKSTLLRLMGGLARPTGGIVRVESEDIWNLPARLRARRIALLPQHLPRDLGLTAREIVLMGRFPHRRFGLFDRPADHAVVGDVMNLTQTTAFADRSIDTLSGGEAQRVHVAAALAQQPDLLLLDEPAAALDLNHQLQLLDILRELTHRRGLAVVVVTHDLNFAWRAASHVLLLHEGRPVASGAPADVMRPETLEQVYDVRLGRAAAHRAHGDWLVVTGPRQPDGAPT